MKIKKSIAAFLVLSFMSLFVSPLSSGVSAQGENLSLAEFLKTTEKIDAKYSYPSLVAITDVSGKSTLAAHTPIIIRCTETITTKDIVSGGSIDFAIVADVKDSNGNIIIKAGTPATAQITFSKSKGRIGQSGELTVSDFHTTAVDGTYVPLSGSVSARVDDKMVMSICLSLFVCPLFLLMKGEDAQLSAGTQKTVYTVTEIYVKPVKS